MKTKINTATQQLTSFCSHCQRELPLEFFYTNKRTQCPDRYCKECRKTISRQKYDHVRIQSVMSQKCSYPVITEISDRELRMKFIFHALHEVQQSIERRKTKMKLLWQE